MAKFYLFGRYSQSSVGQISSGRTKKALDLIAKFKGKVKSMDALLGEKDLVFVIEFPSSKEALKASLSLTKLTGITFATSEAITVDELDELASEV